MKKYFIIFPTIGLFQFLNSQTVLDWIPISQTPNKMVYSFSEYQGKLITAGMFDSAGLSKFNKIAAWNESNIV